jgi:rhamnosyltransferase
MAHETIMNSSSSAIQQGMTNNLVCAVVVAFFPDADFEARLREIIPQVNALVVVDNTPVSVCKQRLKTLTEHAGYVQIIENHANVGVAEALNQGLERAEQLGCKWLLTLDQDTQCYPGMVGTLISVYEVCEPKPAVIGSNYYNPNNNRPEVNPDGGGQYLERITVITSGSLVDAKLAHALGGFREDYFIDQVDHEFCLRMRSHGYRVVICRKPVMSHSVGATGGVWVPFLGTLPNHPPLRKYYIARNTLATLSAYWRKEPEWCLRRLIRLLLGLLLMATLEGDRLAKIRAFAAGIMDGVRQRMGVCQREWYLKMASGSGNEGR